MQIKYNKCILERKCCFIKAKMTGHGIRSASERNIGYGITNIDYGTTNTGAGVESVCKTGDSEI